MEALIATGKIVGGVIITAIINKFLSAFRVRQLYLSYDDILNRYDSGVSGHTASIKIYNRGKDKEKSIEITFPNTDTIQIISADYPSITTNENKVLIDRVLPGQTISFNIFLATLGVPSNKTKPIIKSEDANGRTFLSRGNVPPSLGPIVWVTSISTTIILAFAYMIGTKNDPIMLYFKLKNPTFISQGLTPLTSSSFDLIPQRQNENDAYPIELDEPTYEKDKIILSFKISNPTTNKLYLGVRSDYPDREYYNEMGAASRLSTTDEKLKAYEDLAQKYGYEELFNSLAITLEPKERKTIEVTRKIIPNTTIANLNLIFSFDGTTASREEINDIYTFSPDKSIYAEDLKKYIDKTQKSTYKTLKSN